MARFVNVATMEYSSILRFEKPKRNDPACRDVVLNEIRQRFDDIRGHSLDLVVTCEDISGFGQTVKQAESLETPGPLLEMYADFARSERLYLAGSTKIRENECVYNSVVLFGPQGTVIGRYDKTFNTFGEIDEGLISGNGAVVIDTDLGRVGFAICFDLNFRSLLQEYESLRPDMILFSSMFHGGFMQSIWAYWCRSFFISSTASNDCGIIDPVGQPVALSHKYQTTPMATINLDRVVVHLNSNQEKFHDMIREYGSDVAISIPPHVGVAVVYSQAESRTAIDIAKKYDLTLIDDFFDKAIKANERNRVQKTRRRNDIP